MFMAVVEGFNDIYAFSDDIETAKKNAVRAAKKEYLRPGDANRAYKTWETLLEYHAAFVIEIKDGMTTNTDRIKCGYTD